MQKKAQITVYIIIALVLILSLFLLYYQSTKIERFRPTIIIPDDVMPVKRYFEQCLYDSAKQALLNMGYQGGFIELPSEILRDRNSYINHDKLGVEKIPFWYYKGFSHQPTWDYITLSFNKYMQKKLKICSESMVRDFNPQFKINTYKMLMNISFNDDDVEIKVDMPVELISQAGKKSTKLRYFQVKLPVRFKKIYGLANKTFAAELKSLYLENITFQFMTSNFDFPFTGLEFDCKNKNWRISKLKSEFKNILFYNLPRARVKNTNYQPFLEPEEKYEQIIDKAKKIRQYLLKSSYDNNDPFAQAVKSSGIKLSNIPKDMYEYSHLFIDVDADPDALSEKFFFNKDWGMDFVVRPAKGDYLNARKSKGVKKFLSFLCVNFYHFTYSLYFPVEAIIYDNQSFPNEGGYSFRFVIPVVIKENEALDKSQFKIPNFSSKPPASYDFCDAPDQKYVEITVKGLDQGYFDQDLKGVNLTYQCMYYYCNLGQTGIADGTYKFKGSVPSICANPTITAQKQGFLSSTAILKGHNLTMHLEKLHPLELSMYKLIYNSKDPREEQKRYSERKGFDEGEYAVVYLSLINSSIDYDQYLEYPLIKISGSNINETKLKTLYALESGAKYDLDIILIRGNKTVGGYKFTNLSIQYKDIKGKTKIKLPVIEYRPTPISDKEEMDMMAFVFGESYKGYFKPEYD